MKKIYYSLFSLMMMFIVTSLTIQQNETPRSFEKIVWVELDYKSDSVLFTPYSKAWKEMWQMIDPDISFNGTPAMNIEKYKFSFTDRKDNLYTIIHPKIIDGSLQLYSPYDPISFGMGTKDEGELRFPVKGKNGSETFLTSEELRNELCYYIGNYGAMPDIPLVDEYGEPVTKLDSVSGILMYVYPPRDYMWYEDNDIIKYKLRVSISYNSKGIEKKRTIKAIAPVVNEIDEMTGEIMGERELFWLNYDELTPTLKEAYYFDASGKPVTYLKHIEQRVNDASF